MLSDGSPPVYWDAYYYWFSVNAQLGASTTLIEYPTPVVWFLSVIYAFAPGRETFQLTFALTLVTLDGLTAVALWRKNPDAGRYWVIFGAAAGAIGYYRLDLLPAALVTLACLWAYARPRTSGAALGLGAAIKLWLALLALPLIGSDIRTRSARSRLAGFVAVGGGLGLASLIGVRWDRSISPLVWQHDRGLQIESVAATPLMVAKLFTSEGSVWLLSFSRYKAWEILGPGADLLLTAATIGTFGVFTLVCWLGFRGYRRHTTGESVVEGTLATVLASVCWLIVVNKTFSPQYIWWLAGPLALLFALGGRAYRCLGWSVATQYVYPWAYETLVAGDAITTFILAARNIGMVTLAVVSTTLAWRATNPHFRVASSLQA